ncbi:MAG TPA: hypothetical protein VFQ53_15360 [Kofleriaceae bacterium]|nr:hypothetical protein [Kofleriaceae bacterium]
MKRLGLFVIAIAALSACTDDDDGGGDCTGSVLGCTWAELSAAQEMEACDLITASIDDGAGTKYECTEGPNAGLSLTVDSASTCVARSYPAGCPVTVQQTLDCFKAAKTNACSAFDDAGACGRLFASAAQCQ